MKTHEEEHKMERMGLAQNWVKEEAAITMGDDLFILDFFLNCSKIGNLIILIFFFLLL